MKGNDGTGNVIERDDWQTPTILFDKLHEQYDFDFDCCASKDNSKVGVWTDSLEYYWSIRPDWVCWMNPPFSKAEEMFNVFFDRASKGVCIYRCDNLETSLWQDIILKKATWVFIPKGRISYEGKVGKGSRFPSALIGFNVPVPNGLDGVTLIVHITNNLEDQK